MTNPEATRPFQSEDWLICVSNCSGAAALCIGKKYRCQSVTPTNYVAVFNENGAVCDYPADCFQLTTPPAPEAVKHDSECRCAECSVVAVGPKAVKVEGAELRSSHNPLNDAREAAALYRRERDVAEERIAALQRTVAEQAKRLAEIDSAANADASDLAEMRDGMKLTRAGVVQVIAYQQQDLKELRAKLAAAEKAQPWSLPQDVLALCKHRGWSLHWTHRGAYLHLESSELIEAIRGKHGDPKEEAADVLIVLCSITENAGIQWESVVECAAKKVKAMFDKPPYAGEEAPNRADATPQPGDGADKPTVGEKIVSGLKDFSEALEEAGGDIHKLPERFRVTTVVCAPCDPVRIQELIEPINARPEHLRDKVYSSTGAHWTKQPGHSGLEVGVTAHCKCGHSFAGDVFCKPPQSPPPSTKSAGDQQ